MSEVSTHILAVLEPSKSLGEQAASIVELSKSLENIPVEAKKSWADLVDEELDNQPVPSPTIVSDFINENNVEQLIDVISTVWIESETRSLDIKLDLDLVSESCAKLFIKIRKTFPTTRWPLTQAFIFVEHLQPFDLQVQDDLKQLSATLADYKDAFDDNTLTDEQKKQLDTIAELEKDMITKIAREITILACRKIPSKTVYEKLTDFMVAKDEWDMRFRYICSFFLALGNSYTNNIRAQEKAVTCYCLGLSMEIMKDRVKMKEDVARDMKRSVLQYATFFRIVARQSDAQSFWLALLKFQTFFDELRDIVLEPKSDKIEMEIVLAYLDIVYNLALNRGQHLIISKNTHIMDFLFSCLKNQSQIVQKAALHALCPTLEGSPLTSFLGANRITALIKQLEVHMNKTWLIKSGDLIKVIGLLSKEFNEKLKHHNVVAKYAPILNSRYDGKEVQLDLLRCLQTMTVGAGDNPNVIEGITMVHAVPGVFENIIRIVKQAKEGTDIFLIAFRLLSQLIIPNTAIINKIYETSVQKDVRRALLSDTGLHTEAVYFVSQLVNCTFEQKQIDELINDFYAPVLERLKTAQNETLLAYGLICLSLLARCKDEVNVKQVVSCATAKTKDGETVLDILTTEKFIFSPLLNVRCGVFKVFSSLSTVPSTANLLVDYGLVPPLVQMSMFDVDACFQGGPCSPQYHALTALNNIVLFNNTAKQTLRATPMFLMTLQQKAIWHHPVTRAKNALVANVVREDSAKADNAQEIVAAAIKREKEFFKKNPQFVIKNTVKKEIVVPNDLFQAAKPSGPSCNNPVCPNKQKTNLKILNCARCGKVGYCSKECQQAMWPIHKNYCKK